jgi:hypothetical protein
MRTDTSRPGGGWTRAGGPSESAGVRGAFEAEGFRILPDKGTGALLSGCGALAVVTGHEWRRGTGWLERVGQGGTVVLVHPEPVDAGRLGLLAYKGEREEATLRLPGCDAQGGEEILVRGRVSVYGKHTGRVHAWLNVGQDPADDGPGIIEVRLGRGKVLVLLFSLTEFIRHSRQRSPEAARQSGGGSAERIALAGTPERFLFQPQVDMVMAFLCRFISVEMTRLEGPPPRLARLPGGAGSLVTFSVDDFCPTGEPIRQALRGALAAGSGGHAALRVGQGMAGAFWEALHFPVNYEHDVRRLIALFRRYRCTGSAFLLPFLGRIRNRPRLTGYHGFSREVYADLRAAGWDMGTHIKPGSLEDYRGVHLAFCRRFGEPPRGHRGHELGWVGWDADWRAMADLGYSYDTTWSWGGHAGLAWPLGTAYPFHPTAADGQAFPLVEIPVVAWVEDLVGDEAGALSQINARLLRHPGVYHFGAHSWRTGRPAYARVIEAILSAARQNPDVALGANLATLASFWRRREHSGLRDTVWDPAAGRMSYVAENCCEGGDLAVTVPLCWGDRKVTAVQAGSGPVPFRSREVDGMPQAIVPHPPGETRVEVTYT